MGALQLDALLPYIYIRMSRYLKSWSALLLFCVPADKLLRLVWESLGLSMFWCNCNKREMTEADLTGKKDSCS